MEREYEKSFKENKKLIEIAIKKAIKNNHEVYLNIYDEEDRKDGNPLIQTINCFDDIIDEYPRYDEGGCTDLVINTGKEEFFIWYSDHYEDRVYVDEINYYLKEE